MTVNQFTTGRDLSVQINTSYGPLTIPNSAITNFKSSPEVTKLKSKGIDGLSRRATIPDCWKGSLTLDRLNHAIDDYWAQFEADYYAGISIGVGTIVETIQEQDGTITTWRYQDVVLTLEDPGDFSADKKVEQTVSFEASKKVKVS